MENTEPLLSLIKPGTLAFIKKPIVVRKKNSLRAHLDRRLVKEMLAMILSVDIKEPSEDDETYKRYGFPSRPDNINVSFMIDEAIWETGYKTMSYLYENLDIIRLPKVDDEAAVQDEWLSEYYGGFGHIHIAARNFYAHLGDDRDKKGAYGKHFYVKRNERILGYSVRCSAGRRMLIFNFFVNGNLCWFEFEEDSKNKSKRKPFGDYFYSLTEKTPYEKSKLL